MSTTTHRHYCRDPVFNRASSWNVFGNTNKVYRSIQCLHVTMTKVETAAAILRMWQTWTITNPPITTSLSTQSKTVSAVAATVTAGVPYLYYHHRCELGGILGWFMALEVNTDGNMTGVIQYVEVEVKVDVELWWKAKQITRKMQDGPNANLLQEILYVPPPSPASPIVKSQTILWEKGQVSPQNNQQQDGQTCQVSPWPSSMASTQWHSCVCCDTVLYCTIWADPQEQTSN